MKISFRLHVLSFLSVLEVLFLFVSMFACATKPTTAPVRGGSILRDYLAVVNGNGGYFTFCLLASHTVLEGPSIGAIYPQSIRFHGGRLFVVNSSANNLKIYDAFDPDTELKTVQFDPNTNPVEIAFDGEGNAYVSCYDSGCIIKLDPATLSASATLLVPPGQGSNPDGLAVAGNKLYVGLPGFSSGNTVGIVDLASFQFTPGSPVTVGENAQTVIPAGDEIHVVCTSGYNSDWSNKMQGSIHVIDPSTDTVVRTVDLTGADPAFAVASANHRVFVSGWNAGLMVYDAVTGNVLRGPADPIAKPPGGGLMGMTTDTSGLFVCSFMEDTVLRFDLDSYRSTTVFDVGSCPGVLAYVP